MIFFRIDCKIYLVFEDFFFLLINSCIRYYVGNNYIKWSFKYVLKNHRIVSNRVVTNKFWFFPPFLALVYSAFQNKTKITLIWNKCCISIIMSNINNLYFKMIEIFLSPSYFLLFFLSLDTKVQTFISESESSSSSKQFPLHSSQIKKEEKESFLIRYEIAMVIGSKYKWLFIKWLGCNDSTNFEVYRVYICKKAIQWRPRTEGGGGI